MSILYIFVSKYRGSYVQKTTIQRACIAHIGKPQFKELASRISESRNKLQAIVGPRQVGKSTLIKQVLQETEVPGMMVSADGVPKDNTAWIGETWDTAAWESWRIPVGDR